MTFIPVLKPRVADANIMLPHIRTIDDACCYTNHGPQERMLRTQFAAALGDRAVQEISLYSSGTAALIGAMQAWNLPAGTKCLVPAWTFIGSACAVAQAGLEPVIVDVDPESWAIDPNVIEEMATAQNIKACLIVSPFGATVPYPELSDIQERIGMQILVDGAASFDFVHKLSQTRLDLPVPLMVSLHATKLVSSIEGGMVVTSNADMTRRMISWSNFGIFDDDPVTQIGTNAKLSEIHAAYGQHSLTSWPEIRQTLLTIADAYVERLTAWLPDIAFAPNIREGMVSSSFNIILPKPFPQLGHQLAANGIGTRRWWKDGVHRFPAFKSYAAGPLPVTEDLAARTIGLPFYVGMTSDTVETVVAALETALADQSVSIG